MRIAASHFNYKLKMSKLLRIGLIALLATLLSPAAFVAATCGQCYNTHTCTTNTTFQICFNGIPNTELSFTCPSNKPICTQFSDICMTDDAPSGCGDTTKCDKCGDGQMYACASRTTFGRCNNGVLLPERVECPLDWFCSIDGAANGSPCVLVCDPNDEDTCDRVDTVFAFTTTEVPLTTPSPATTPDSSSSSSTTIASTTVDSTTVDSTTPASTTPASTTPASTTPASTTPASTTPASTTTESTTIASTTTESTTPASTTPASTTTESTTIASTTTESTTIASTTPASTTASPQVVASAFCQSLQRMGRYAIPNDTTCTSFISCFFRASIWQGSMETCQADRPYFHAVNACGTTRPTTPGCL